MSISLLEACVDVLPTQETVTKRPQMEFVRRTLNSLYSKVTKTNAVPSVLPGCDTISVKGRHLREPP